MEKISFRSFTGKLRHATRVAKVFVGKNPHIVGAGIGATGGGALGYTEGSYNEKHHKRDVASGVRPGRVKATIGAALGLGIAGGSIGLGKKLERDFRKWGRTAYKGGFGKHKTDAEGNFDFGGAKTSAKAPPWAKGVKTKAEAKKRYHEQVMKNHPDRPGGNAEKMKTINTDWEKWENSPGFHKLSHVLAGLIDELEKLGVKLPSSLTAPPPHLTPIVQQPKTPVRGRMQVPMQQPPDTSAVGPQSTDPKV